MSEGTKTPFRRDLNANVPLDLADCAGLLSPRTRQAQLERGKQGRRRRGGQRGIAYTSPDGPALLKLGRKDGETTVNLVVKNPDAAVKAGMMPKPGQVKVLVANPNEVEAVITINKQTIKAAAGAGTKGPDGPMLDLAPGKYKFSIKLPGKPAQNDELEVGADEIWGLMIGPGGALPLQVY